MLQRELNIKNKQIDELSTALVAAQQTAHAAQTLHVMQIEQKKPGFWARFLKSK
jgi:hypothetical protein